MLGRMRAKGRFLITVMGVAVFLTGLAHGQGVHVNPPNVITDPDITGTPSQRAAKQAARDFDKAAAEATAAEMASKAGEAALRAHWHNQYTNQLAHSHNQLKADESQYVEMMREFNLESRRKVITPRTLDEDYLTKNGLTNLVVSYQVDKSAKTINYCIECPGTNQQAAVWKAIKTVPSRLRISQQTNSVFLVVPLH